MRGWGVLISRITFAEGFCAISRLKQLFPKPWPSLQMLLLYPEKPYGRPGIGPSKSKDPNNRAVGHKCYNIHGIWALKPYIIWVLGPLGGYRDLKNTAVAILFVILPFIILLQEKYYQYGTKPKGSMMYKWPRSL